MTWIDLLPEYDTYLIDVLRQALMYGTSYVIVKPKSILENVTT